MRINPLVLVAGSGPTSRKARGNHPPARAAVMQPLVITCIDRASLAALRGGSGGILHEIVPDIVVFDESFVDHAVPFGAFTARKSLFACWNRPGKATFHSTTFQPNTISTLHFMRCLAQADPEFHGRYSDDSPGNTHRPIPAGRLVSALLQPVALPAHPSDRDLTRGDVRAAGSFIVVNGRPIFDAVSGVACSFRGHNPADLRGRDQGARDSRQRSPASASDRRTAELADEAELRRRLQNLTGLEFFLPAVSGATAVENALKVALSLGFPDGTSSPSRRASAARPCSAP